MSADKHTAETMYDNESESGNVVLVLSRLSGAPENEIERRLQKGITPWTLAKELGILEEFQEIVLERTHARLRLLVQGKQITQQYADEIAASFSRSIPAL